MMVIYLVHVTKASLIWRRSGRAIVGTTGIPNATPFDPTFCKRNSQQMVFLSHLDPSMEDFAAVASAHMLSKSRNLAISTDRSLLNTTDAKVHTVIAVGVRVPSRSLGPILSFRKVNKALSWRSISENVCAFS